MRLRGLASSLCAAVLVLGVVLPTDLACKELEVSGYWGLTEYGENRKMNLEKGQWNARTGYSLFGAQAKMSFPWWRLFGFIDYRYSPREGKTQGQPASELRTVTSSHVFAIGAGRHLGIGSARLDLKAGYARLHDSFTLIQYEQTTRESEIEQNTDGNGLILGADLLTPIFESLSVVLSYNFLYRSSIQVRGDLPVPNICAGDTWSMSVGPDEHSYMVGLAFRF
jgi:hypothetical protein